MFKGVDTLSKRLGSRLVHRRFEASGRECESSIPTQSWSHPYFTPRKVAK